MFGLLVPVLALTGMGAEAQFKDGFTEVDKVKTESGIKKYATVNEAILGIVGVILGIAATLALVAVVVGGVMYILSGGEEDKAKRAKKIIISAIVGLVILGLSAIIVNFIVTFFSE